MAEPGPGARDTEARDTEAAMRRHRERHAVLARRRGPPPLPAPAAAEVRAEEAEAESICTMERAVEAAAGKPAAAAVGRKRRQEGDGVAEAGPSGQRRGCTAPSQADKASRYRGVTKAQGGKGVKPWKAFIQVTDGGKRRTVSIGRFAREEDAARAYDRVSIAKLGHAKAKTNFPVAEYRAEWAELEALGADVAAARERRCAKQQAL